MLKETGEGFGIWDRHGRGEPVEVFPGTADGLDAAEARFKELERSSRRLRRRALVPKVLLGSLIVGSLAWIVGGVGQALLFTVDRLGSPLFLDLTFALEIAGWPLAVGSLVVLAGLALARPPRGAGTVVAPSWPRGRLPKLLAWTVVVGLVIWLASSVATFLTEQGGVLGAVDVGLAQVETGGPSDAFVVSYTIEALSFRVWVASAAVFGLLWIRGDRDARDSSDGLG